MARKRTDCRVQIKAAGEDDGLAPGQFRALVSAFGNRDSYGDVVQPGAFTDTLAEWRDRGDPIPVIWSHDWGDPFSHVGQVDDASETDDGLEVLATLDIDSPVKTAAERAQQVYRLLKSRRVTQFSFAYDVLEGGPATVDGTDVFEINKAKLYEVGPTLIGANQDTDLLAVKARALASGIKEGRVLAASHVTKLRTARDALTEVIEAASPDDDTKSSVAPAAERAEEPTGQPSDTANDPGPRAASSARRERPSPASVRASVIATELIEGV